MRIKWIWNQTLFWNNRQFGIMTVIPYAKNRSKSDNNGIIDFFLESKWIRNWNQKWNNGIRNRSQGLCYIATYYEVVSWHRACLHVSYSSTLIPRFCWIENTLMRAMIYARRQPMNSIDWKCSFALKWKDIRINHFWLSNFLITVIAYALYLKCPSILKIRRFQIFIVRLNTWNRLRKIASPHSSIGKTLQA